MDSTTRKCDEGGQWVTPADARWSFLWSQTSVGPSHHNLRSPSLHYLWRVQEGHTLWAQPDKVAMRSAGLVQRRCLHYVHLHTGDAGFCSHVCGISLGERAHVPHDEVCVSSFCPFLSLQLCNPRRLLHNSSNLKLVSNFQNYILWLLFFYVFFLLQLIIKAVIIKWLVPAASMYAWVI